MEKQSLSKNLVFQFLYQGLILVIPFILSPYLTRTLQETALGIYSYINSIAYYFVILSMLGISRHGQRIISQNSNNATALRKVFWSLLTVHLAISVFCTICYFGFIAFFVKEYKTIYLIQVCYVLSAMFDITWLFYGLENFKSVVAKNALVKIIECALIFLSVKTPDDLWKFTLISVGGIFVGQIVMLPQAFRAVKPIKFSKADAMQHIKPLLVFSISVIAVSLYTVFDKTLLGIMTTKENVAFYEYSNKIVNIPKTVIGVVGTVMFPRACKLASVGDIKGQKKYIDYSFLITAFIGMGSIFGLLAIGKPFATFYYGEAFSICGNVIIALSPLIFIIGIGDIIRTQYMIPNHMDNQFNICILLNAFVNIILSTTLIPVIGIYGAVIGTVSAELFGIIYQIIVCKKFVNSREIFKTSMPFAIAGGMMFCVIRLLQRFLIDGLRSLLTQVVIGTGIYLFLVCIYFVVFRRAFCLALKKKYLHSGK